jgi:zinc protease
VLLVAGKFDEAKTLALVAKNFGAIPRPTRTLPVFWTVEPTQDGERTFTVRRKGDVQVVALAYHVPSGLHDDSDAVGFAAYILGQAPTGRLHKAIVEKGMASQVFSYPMQGVAPGLQMFGAVVKPGDDINKVRDEMVRIIESFGDTPPEAGEISARARASPTRLKALANHESLSADVRVHRAGRLEALLPRAMSSTRSTPRACRPPRRNISAATIARWASSFPRTTRSAPRFRLRQRSRT